MSNWAWTHRIETIGNGMRIHFVEQGDGVPVILLHGVPHLWYSWRNQIPAVASAGWRAVAPDIRGMGQTSIPADQDAYSSAHLLEDAIGLLDLLGEPKAVFVGLDVGANIAWDVALRHPDRVLGVVALNSPLVPPEPVRPTEAWAEMAKEHFIHLHYYQKPGVADKLFDENLREYLRRVFWSLCGEYRYLDIWDSPPDIDYLTALPQSPPLPWEWMSEADMEMYVSEFHRTGTTGMLNHYRCWDRNWELSKEVADRRISAPALLIAADRDCEIEGFRGESPLKRMNERFDNLHEIAWVHGAGHMVQMERPAEVNDLLVRFLSTLS